MLAWLLLAQLATTIGTVEPLPSWPIVDISSTESALLPAQAKNCFLPRPCLSICYADCTVHRTQDFTVAGDHAGLLTDGYRLLVGEEVIAELPVSALQPTSDPDHRVINFAVIGGTLPRGDHVLIVQAYQGEVSIDSAPLALRVK